MSIFKKLRGTKAPKLDRRVAWEEAAHLVGGRFVEGRRKHEDRVEWFHGQHKIWLDTYTVSTGQVTITYTRAACHFVASEAVSVLLRKRMFVDSIAESLGFGGVPLHDRALAERYLLKGRPKARLRSFMSDGLREVLLELPPVRLGVQKASRRARKEWGSMGRLTSTILTGVHTDPPLLVLLLRSTRETLDALDRTGFVRRDS